MSEKELMNENAEILEEEKTVSRNFIEQIRIYRRAYMRGSTPDSRRNLTDTCTSDMPRVSF